MYKLGSLYVKGEGVAQDDAKALKWFQKAADAGDTDAMVRAAFLYECGNGVAKDPGKAHELYQKARQAAPAPTPM
jgi:TPR repeat protein